ncbi:MAG: hypothetical protein D6760_07690, partial [Deltaproteobacteria bacterium]
MKMRLLPEDEYMHEVEEAESFNESMYFNVYDPDRGVGGFVRLGNRPNEGYAEMTTCLFLPGGRVGFMFARPEISSNEAFDAGGMRFDVIEPFKRLRARYAGPVVLLDDPLEMSDPRRAFTENPHVPCEIDLEFTGVSPMYGGEPVGDDGRPLLEAEKDAPFARGHYEQHMAGAGRIEVGDQSWAIDGFGLRDHSWGPRYWQSPWFYRWLTANFDRDFGFVVSVITSRDGSERIGGMILSDGRYDHIRQARIDTKWKGEQIVHDAIGVEVVTESGASYHIDGEVMSLIPLRN